MERKTKHRIIGLLVIVGLAIIALPFLLVNSDVATETTAMKVPPLPEQAVQMSEDSNEGFVTEPVVEDAPLENKQQETVENKASPEPSNTIQALHPSVINAEASDIPLPKPTTRAETSPQRVEAPLQRVETREPAVSVKKAIHVFKQPVNKHAAPAKMKVAQVIKPIDNNGLFKLKKAVWVIQIGSFKNKANALRLVNRLRAKGYPAFIQQVAYNTRVFVGPENKQGSARNLATQLKNEMKIEGFVISYKPLTL